jgi:hypothetical protein
MYKLSVADYIVEINSKPAHLPQLARISGFTQHCSRTWRLCFFFTTITGEMYD